MIATGNAAIVKFHILATHKSYEDINVFHRKISYKYEHNICVHILKERALESVNKNKEKECNVSTKNIFSSKAKQYLQPNVQNLFMFYSNLHKKSKPQIGGCSCSSLGQSQELGQTAAYDLAKKDEKNGPE